jgi:hypothetical protein
MSTGCHVKAYIRILSVDLEINEAAFRRSHCTYIYRSGTW